MTEPSTIPSQTYLEVPLKALVPSPLNPRKHFDAIAIQDLAATMGNGVGVIQPLAVRLAAQPTLEEGVGVYEIVAGESRYRAATLAELETVPIVVKALTDAQVLEIMLIENKKRRNLRPLEEAAALKQLLGFGSAIEDVAERLGLRRRDVIDSLQLLELIPAAQELLQTERISLRHAILLSRLTPEQQEKAIDPETGGLFEREHSLWTPAYMAAKSSDPYEGLKVVTVREFQEWIDQHTRLDVADPLVPELLPELAAAVADAQEAKTKVISITYSRRVHPDAKGSGRIYGPDFWKRADGQERSKTCDHGVLGVVVEGQHRAQHLTVCINKTGCLTHWPAEKKAAEHKVQQQATETPEARQKREVKEAAQREKQQEIEEATHIAVDRCLEQAATSTTKVTRGLLAAIAAVALDNHDLPLDRQHLIAFFKIKSRNGYYIDEAELAPLNERTLLQLLGYLATAAQLPYHRADVKQYAKAFAPAKVDFPKVLEAVTKERAAAKKAAATPAPSTTSKKVASKGKKR